MQSVVGLLLFFAAALVKVNAQHNQYVDQNSVQCDSNGITYTLRKDDSDLWTETEGTGDEFHIDISTGDPSKPLDDDDFKPITGIVNLPYARYQVVAVTTYGPNAQPLLYYIQQPFTAVPQEGYGGAHQSFEWSVYCSIPAYSYVNVSTNTTDQGHGGSGGETVNPKDHYDVQIQGVGSDNDVQLGDPLTYVLELHDTTYAALMPTSCQYYNPADETQHMPIVSDGCPQVNKDEASYFGTMTKENPGRYSLSFKAFAFETDPNSELGISCSISLCVQQHVDDCYKACWGGPPPPTTEAPPTEQPTEAPPTTAPEEPDTTTVTEEPPPQYRRKRDAGTNDDPQNGYDQQKKEIRVYTEGESPSKSCVCDDKSLQNALYGIIGGLAALVLVMAITLVVLFYNGRQKRYGYNEGPAIMDGPPLYMVPNAQKSV